MQLGNIQVDTIRNGSIGDNMVLTATLNFDQRKITALSARIAGRVDKLYFKNIGDYIHKGDKLLICIVKNSIMQNRNTYLHCKINTS